MKLSDRIMIHLELLPIFLMGWSVICFILSFHMEFYDWFRDASQKNIECPMIFVIVLWAMSVYYDWRIWSKASILYLFIMNVADNIFLINNDLNQYGGIFAIAAGIMAVLYAAKQVRSDD